MVVASPVSEVLPDAGPCRWCSHGQWSHKRGRAGCTHPECGGMCDRYAPPKDRPVPEPVADAVTVADVVLAEEARASVALDGETVALGPVVVGQPEERNVLTGRPHPTLAEVQAEPEPVDAPEPEPVPVLADPAAQAAQAEYAEQVAAIDEQLAQPQGELEELRSDRDAHAIAAEQNASELDMVRTLSRQEIARLSGQLGARLRDLDQAQEQVAQLQRGARVLSAERNEARAELANLRREVVEREEQIARERGARSAEIAQLREELARATTARQRIQEQLDTAVHTGLSAVSQVIGRYTAHACLNCGARYGLPFTDHACGPLVPVVVTIARADRPGSDTSKEQ